MAAGSEEFAIEADVFIYGCYGVRASPFGGILKLDRSKFGKINESPFEIVTLFDRGHVDADGPLLHWRVCSLTEESTTLCLFPIRMYNHYEIDEQVPFKGFIFDAKTDKIVESLPVSTCTKLLTTMAVYHGEVFSLGGKIYFFMLQFCRRILPSFERYDCENKRWECLPDWPRLDQIMPGNWILGHAVFDDFVLFDIQNWGIWAFYPKTNEWYQVKTVSDKTDIKDVNPGIRGLGLVLGNKNLYSIHYEDEPNNLYDVKVISMMKEETDDDGVLFTCRLLMTHSFTFPSTPESYKCGRAVLAHLGNKDFCLVASCTNNLVVVNIALFTLQEDNSLCRYKTYQNIFTYDDGPWIYSEFAFSLPLLYSLPVPLKKTLSTWTQA